MDDLNGLFSAPQQSVPQSPGVMPQNTSTFPMGMLDTPQMQMMPNNNNFQQIPMGQQPQMQVPLNNMANMIPGQQQFMGQQQQQLATSMMTPTQTTAASQLNNKTQILNQFQTPAAPVNQFGGMMPPRPAPGIPVQIQQQPQMGMPPQQQQQQIPQQNNFNDTFMSSVSVTEPGPVEFDDGLFGSPVAISGNQDNTNDVTDNAVSFTIESPKIIPNENNEEVAETEEKKEEVEADGEATPKTPKTGFWTGLWNRNKDHGSKENIIDESDKKDDEGKVSRFLRK